MTTVTDPTNEWYTTSQQSTLTARPRQGVVLHHGATTDMDAIIDMETSGSKQVSSNRVAKDKRLAKIVDDGMRAWSLSSAYYDSILWSCECANESTNGWTISAESQETLAQWVAYLAQREDWWPNRSGDPSTWTVFGHREIYLYFGASYPTACPGGMDLDWITARAQQLTAIIITKGTDMPSMMSTPKTGGGFRFIITDGRSRKRATEDQAEANNWTFALCGGILPTATNVGTPQEQQLKLAAFKWLDAQLWPDYFADGGSVGGGNGPTLAQIVAAVDAADDDEHAAIIAAIAAAAKAGGTPADFVAALKSAL